MDTKDRLRAAFRAPFYRGLHGGGSRRHGVAITRVLVTGANGFVGRNLVMALRARSIQVTVAVRRIADFPPEVRNVSIEGVGPDTDWRAALDGCDSVVHLAARVHLVRDSSPDPLGEYRRVNVDGTLSLASQAAASGVRRFVFLSSIKVNGEVSPPGRGFRETDHPAPTDAYGISKAEAEAKLVGLGREAGLDVVVIRPPLVYGPGVRANFLSMTRWLLRGVPLPFGAVVDNRRSLVALDNLVDLIHKCLGHPAAGNQLFLAADGEDLSTTQLLERTAAALGVRARLIPVPVGMLTAGAALVGRPDVMRRLTGSLQVDIAKARDVLGWNPPISVDEGLRRAVKGIRRTDQSETRFA